MREKRNHLACDTNLRSNAGLARHTPILNGARSLWEYRVFILGSVKREFQAKYNGSLLGSAWTAINPLSMIFVYTIIFSRVMHARLPGSTGNEHGSYGIFLCAGIFSWGLFSEVINRCIWMFINNAGLLKKLSFPRLCLPTIEVLSSTINFIVVLSLLSAFLVINGSFPGCHIIAAVPLTVILLTFAVGLGINLGILNVFFRDVGPASGILLQFWFWLTPIVYTADILPVRAQTLININPMTPIIDGFQRILVAGTWPKWNTLIYPSTASILLCFISYILFTRNSGDIVDEL